MGVDKLRTSERKVGMGLDVYSRVNDEAGIFDLSGRHIMTVQLFADQPTKVDVSNPIPGFNVLKTINSIGQPNLLFHR